MLKIITKYSLFTLIIVLVSSMALPQSTLLAQNNLKIYEDIGGGSGTGSAGSDSDNSFVYIAGGLLVAGVIAYALFFRKGNKEKEESDSTQALNILNRTGNEFYSSNLEKEITAAKESFPVDILLSVRKEDAFISDKTYMMGVSVRF
ncbi:MAG: hypothetical protein DRQ01_04955 [Ignavibacteriae bacterium]|nr:MAG: hypothetical protein DRQ01_04955 [Ignavibacteriota bacterium]